MTEQHNIKVVFEAVIAIVAFLGISSTMILYWIRRHYAQHCNTENNYPVVLLHMIQTALNVFGFYP